MGDSGLKKPRVPETAGRKPVAAYGAARPYAAGHAYTVGYAPAACDGVTAAEKKRAAPSARRHAAFPAPSSVDGLMSGLLGTLEGN